MAEWIALGERSINAWVRGEDFKLLTNANPIIKTSFLSIQWGTDFIYHDSTLVPVLAWI
jgi:hypothetical protein